MAIQVQSDNAEPITVGDLRTFLDIIDENSVEEVTLVLGLFGRSDDVMQLPLFGLKVEKEDQR